MKHLLGSGLDFDFFSNFLATFLTLFSLLFTCLLSALNDLNVDEKTVKC